MTTGFLLGKFMPLHRGHMHLIETAQSRVDGLTVLVCSLRREPIPGELRTAWVRGLFPGVNVCHHADDIPQTPDEHPDFWNIWRRAIRRYLPDGPDFVFSSEPYGDPLAAILGAQHICVDLGRSVWPVSGSLVRADPRAHWHMLPPVVQAYYVSLGF